MRSYGAFHYLFRNDSVKKAIKIYYYNGSGTSNLTNEYVSSESFEYEQCLCDEEQLEPGQCNASWIKFKLGNTPANFPSNMVGKWMQIEFIPDRKQNLTLGVYYGAVDTIDEQGFRTITAYDRLSQILNTELIDWYNGLFPDPETDSYTLKQFRDSLFTYLGVTQVSTTLVNDSMIVKKTVEATSLSGKDVLEAICQLNGVWGQMNSDNYFKYVSLASVIWTVGPSGKYMEEEHEDYVSDVIDKVQIRGSENDVGVIVGSGTNALVVQGNFLTFGMSSADLTTVATNLLNKVDNYQVKPFKLTIPGDPVLECGDGVSFTPVGGTQFTAYILKRKLTGIQAMTDVLEARCNKTRSERITSTNYQLMQIMGKTNELTRTVEETQSTITQILDPTDPTSLQSQITQNAQAITLKVSKGEVISSINQSAEAVTIDANRINLNGAVTANNNVTIDVNGVITAKGGDFEDCTITSKSSSSPTRYSVDIAEGQIILRDKNYSNTGKTIELTSNFGGEINFYKWSSGTRKIGSIYAVNDTIYHTVEDDSSSTYPGSITFIAGNSTVKMSIASNYGYLYGLWYGVLTSPSDSDLKKDIKDIIAEAITAIGSVDLKQFIFNYKDETRNNGKIVFGAIAQDVVKALEENGLDPNDFDLISKVNDPIEKNEYYALNYDELAMAKIAYLQNKVDSLEERLCKLEELLAKKEADNG